jgi:hypothetical protein
MNVIPKGAPAPAPQNTQPTQSQQSARDRAINLISKSTPIPVNPNAISPEDISAVTSQTVTKDISETPKSPEATKSQPKEEPLSSQFAVLARKEKALRQKAQQLEAQSKAKEADFLKQKAAWEADQAKKDAEYQSKYIPKDRLTNDTINALLESGLTYDQITQAFLSQPNPQEAQLRDLQRKIDERAAATETSILDKINKQVQENQAAQVQQALHQMQQDTDLLLKSDPETYEAIIATGSRRDVVDLVKKTFDEDGILISVEDAAKEVEEYLIEEAAKLSQLKKIQRRNTPQPKAAVSQQTTQQTKQPQTLKTLSNAIGTPSGKLSAKERAILAFKGELKS